MAKKLRMSRVQIGIPIATCTMIIGQSVSRRPSPLNIRNRGMRTIWGGKNMPDTITRNSSSLPRNGSFENTYPARMPSPIEPAVAGTVTRKVLAK